jgi:ribosome-binding protein aMBF1 (putative translation factor)
MRCTICKKDSDDIQLFEGIFNCEMVNICESCAEVEGVPIIKKPSESQLDKASERYTVRERMERMAGVHEPTDISEDQMTTQGNLAKLRVPPKKQTHEDVLDNYYWTLNIARRRKKLSLGQLADLIKIEEHVIKAIEKGVIPENFEEVFLKLESFLGIKLLKNPPKKINFTRDRNQEKEILKQVGERIGQVDSSEADELLEEIDAGSQEKIEKIKRGEVDFSRREQLEDVTLNDLVEMKKKRERGKITRRAQVETDAMIGEDLEIDLDDL